MSGYSADSEAQHIRYYMQSLLGILLVPEYCHIKLGLACDMQTKVQLVVLLTTKDTKLESLNMELRILNVPFQQSQTISFSKLTLENHK